MSKHGEPEKEWKEMTVRKFGNNMNNSSNTAECVEIYTIAAYTPRSEYAGCLDELKIKEKCSSTLAVKRQVAPPSCLHFLLVFLFLFNIFVYIFRSKGRRKARRIKMRIRRR